MTSIAHDHYSTLPSGAAGVASANAGAKPKTSASRGLSAILLSAMVAAIMVVAYQLMDSVSEGHLMVIWLGLWAAAFATLALFAGTARNVAARVISGLDGWSRSLAEARADQRLWSLAKTDDRVMADLQGAMARQESDISDETAKPAATIPGTDMPAPSRRIKRMGGEDLRAYYRYYY
jgi:hypothetical protein